MTLKQLPLLSCLDFLETNIEPSALFSGITLVSPISPTPDPALYSAVVLNFVMGVVQACVYSMSQGIK